MWKFDSNDSIKHLLKLQKTKLDGELISGNNGWPIQAWEVAVKTNNDLLNALIMLVEQVLE